MRVVEKAMLYPQACAVTGWEDGPFVDTGVTIPAGRDYRLYLRTSVVIEAGEKAGMVPADELEKTAAERDELVGQVAALEGKVAVLTAMIEAVSEKPQPVERPKPAPRKKASA